MGYYTENKAAGARSKDPLETILSPAAPQQASNQARFTSPDLKTVPTKDVGNQAKSQANDQGTGKENITTTMALASKRKLDVKLPANY